MGLFDKKPKPQPQQGPSQKVTGGRVNNVVCPYCGQRNNLQGLHKGAHTSSLGGGGSNLLEPGAEFNCDHCFRIYQVLKVEEVTIVSVRQHPKRWRETASREIKR